MLDRPSPSSPEAELGLLCAICADPQSVLTMCAERKVASDWFADATNGTIYRVAAELWTDGKPVDPVSLLHSFHSSGGQEASARAGELFYEGFPSNAGYYAEILAEKRTLREVIRVARAAERAAYEEQEDPAGVLAAFERAATGIASGNAEVEKTFKEHLLDAIGRLQERVERKSGMIGLPTGIDELDKLTGGLVAPDVIVVSAETGGGKTALACNFIEAAAVTAKVTVAVFSYEMTNAEITDRLLVSAAKVNLLNYRQGWVSDVDEQNLLKAVSKMSDARVILRDDAELNVGQVRAVARRIRQKHGLGLIVIDYAQLMPESSGRKGSNREQEVAFISRQCKAMAKELDTPVVVLSQLNDDGKLRESRAIGHDANMVLLVQEEEEKGKPRHYIRIAKQRNGPRDRVPVTFLKPYTRFENYAPERESPPDPNYHPGRSKQTRNGEWKP